MCAGFANPSTTPELSSISGPRSAKSDFAFDFFHLSLSGEAKVAAAAWNAGFYAAAPQTILGYPAAGRRAPATRRVTLDVSGPFPLTQSAPVTQLRGFVGGGSVTASAARDRVRRRGRIPGRGRRDLGRGLACRRPAGSLGSVRAPTGGAARRRTLLARLPVRRQRRPDLVRQRRRLAAVPTHRQLLGNWQRSRHVRRRVDRRPRLLGLCDARLVDASAAVAAGEHGAAGDQRHGAGGADAERVDGDVVGQPDRLRLPVAPLRQAAAASASLARRP